MISIEGLEGFEWDPGNLAKSHAKHRVTPAETEQIFFNEPLLLLSDEKRSGEEPRFLALGHTHDRRRLFVVFTLREKRIRIISSRDMSRKERAIYDKA